MPDAGDAPGARRAPAARRCPTRRRGRGRCASRSTIITFSARSFAEPRARAGRRPRRRRGGVPLIGRVTTSRPRRRRNSSGERPTVAPHGPASSAPWRGWSREAGGERVERVARERALDAHREVRLEELAGVRCAPRTPPRPPAAQRRRAAPSERAGGKRARRAGPPGRQPRAPLGQRAGALRGLERLEPPAAAGVEAQDVVVERERERRQPGARGRRRGQALDEVAEREAEMAEPAAAHRIGVLLGAGDRRLLVEDRERVLVRLGDPDGLRAEDRAAGGPRPGQGERAVVAAQRENRLGGRPVDVERLRHEPRGRPAHSVPRDGVAEAAGQRRAAGLALAPVGGGEQLVDRVDAGEAQGLGLPAARRGADPRQARQLGVAPQQQVAQRATGEVRRRTPSPT